MTPVVELRRPRRIVVGDMLRAFEFAVISQVGGDAGSTEGMVSDPGVAQPLNRGSSFCEVRPRFKCQMATGQASMRWSLRSVLHRLCVTAHKGTGPTFRIEPQ
jgi:hypothetical protein